MLYRLTFTRHDDRDREIGVTVQGPAHRKGVLRKLFVDRVLDLGMQECEGKPFTVEIAQYWPLDLGYKEGFRGLSWAQTSRIDEYSWYPATAQEVEV